MSLTNNLNRISFLFSGGQTPSSRRIERLKMMIEKLNDNPQSSKRYILPHLTKQLKYLESQPLENHSKLATIISYLHDHYTDRETGYLQYHEILHDITFMKDKHLPSEYLSNPYLNGKIWAFLRDVLELPNDTETLNELLICWSSNIIYLTLLIQIQLDIESLRDQNEFVIADRLNYLEKYHIELRRLLPSYIRNFLKPSSFRLVKRLYVGYDTEYQQLEHGINDIISSQLVITSTLGVKILNTNLTYDFSRGYTGTGQRYLIKINDKLMDYPTLLDTFKDLLNLMKPDISQTLELQNNFDNLVSEGKLVKDLDKSNNPSYFLPVNNDKESRKKYLEVFKLFSREEGYSIKELIKDIEHNGESLLNYNATQLKELFPNNVSKNLFKSIKCHNHTEVFLLCHFSIADLSILTDYEDFKQQFDILRKSLTSATKPFRVNNVTLYLRDTANLCDPRTKLENLGDIYELPKLDLPKGSYSRIRKLSEENPDLFKEYGIRDSLIALVHGLELQRFSLTVIQKYQIPIAIASLARDAYYNLLMKLGIPDYNQLGEYHIADFKNIFTSKGIQELGDIAAALPYFIGAYRGGRNESFAVGIDKNFQWSDQDLTGAYSTILSQLGIPDYRKVFSVNGTFPINKYLSDPTADLGMVNWENSYAVFKINFEFPENVIYPNIPISIGKSATIFPLKGQNALASNYDLKVAKDNNCKYTVIDGYIIPYVKDKKGNVIRPFLKVLSEWAILRKEAKAVGNRVLDLLYKLLGNGLYGQICTGLNNKRTFDARLGIMRDNSYSRSTNPIIGQAISGGIRATLSELLNEVDKLGGKIVSCTTDGFLNNLSNLHERDFNTPMAELFKAARGNITGKPELLEEKDHGVGIISWKTRGQCALGGSKGGGIAATGIQRGKYGVNFSDIIIDCFENNTDEILYIQDSLRGANDIYKEGGSVTMKKREQIFRLSHDSRRIIINPENLNTSSNLLFSKPHPGIESGLFARFLMKVGINKYEGLQSHVSNIFALRVQRKGDMLIFCIRMFLRYFRDQLDLGLFYHFLKNSGVKRNIRTVRRWKFGQYYPNEVPQTEFNLLFMEKVLDFFPVSLPDNFWKV
jgi:hypothetical protein